MKEMLVEFLHNIRLMGFSQAMECTFSFDVVTLRLSRALDGPNPSETKIHIFYEPSGEDLFVTTDASQLEAVDTVLHWLQYTKINFE